MINFRHLLGIGIAFALILVIGFSLYDSKQSDNDDLGINGVEDYLQISVPTTATDLVLDGNLSRVEAFITLVFNAPPMDAVTFGEGICNGLFDGFDPFNAIDTHEPIIGSHLIKHENFTYYSYSINTSDTIMGNRCLNRYGYIYQISVNTEGTDYYQVRFEMPGGSCREISLPCFPQGLGRNYINPIDDLPLMVVGLSSQNDEFLLVHNELCIDFHRDYEFGWQADPNYRRGEVEWDYLIAAEVSITIDNQLFPTGIITEQRRLVPANEPISYWAYCSTQNWNEGQHVLEIQIVTGSLEESYSVNFVVD